MTELLASRRRYTSPGALPVDPDENLASVLWKLRAGTPERPVVAVRRGDGFEDWSARRLVGEVERLACGLVAAGIRPGDRVALLSGTRVEFTLLDYAIWAAGAVAVPLYETSSAEQIAWILSDSGARLLFCADEVLAAVAATVADRTPACERTFVIDGAGLDELAALGDDVPADVLVGRAAITNGASVATIVYTSGTTGRPKGCVLTHGNLLWDAVQVTEAGREFFFAGQRTLLFLPLAHIFARVVQVSCLRAGITLGYATGTEHLVDELRMFRPDFLLAVPRVFEKVLNGARQRAAADGRVRVFDAAIAVAERTSRERAQGRLTPPTRAAHALFDRLVYARLRAALGGRVRFAISGGAALGDRLGHVFEGIGVTVLEGYGLTESSAGATINRPTAQRIGSVGKPVPGASVRIADDGEVELGGPHIFAGYFGDAAATAEVLTGDGWLRTGDLGRLDGEGYLFIVGRKKELIVTAAGKNVAPTVLEDPLRAHPLVSQAVVVGDGRPFIAALLTLDGEALSGWATQQGIAELTVAAARTHPEVLAELQAAVDAANRNVSRAESIRTFAVLADDFTVGVELSQKMSLRRHVIMERHADAIAGLYGGVG
jgi:long-chain acyl-CoA synthetase